MREHGTALVLPYGFWCERNLNRMECPTLDENLILAYLLPSYRVLPTLFVLLD